jgi:hypothetical protein
LKLYELTGAFNDIFNLLESDDELNFDALEDTLQSLEGAIEYKAGGVAKMIKSLEAEAKGFDEEAKRLAEKKKTAENKAKWLKDYLLQAMEALAKDKIKTDIGTVSRRKSPAGVYVDAEKLIPSRFWYQPEPQLDRRALLEDLKQGIEIPGAALRQGYHIRIQ